MAKLFQNLEIDIENLVKNWINQWLNILNNDIKLKTPIDTWELIWNNIIINAKSDWNTIKGSVYNETKHALYVEYWIKSKNYNYYKWNRKSWWTPYYIWVWARMFTRAYDEKKVQIMNLIRNSIKNAK